VTMCGFCIESVLLVHDDSSPCSAGMCEISKSFSRHVKFQRASLSSCLAEIVIIYQVWHWLESVCPKVLLFLFLFSEVCILYKPFIHNFAFAAVLTSRIRAMWSHNKRDQNILIICVTLCWAAIFVLVGIFIFSSRGVYISFFFFFSCQSLYVKTRR
jgi:hypothetical protein